jgi:hypothetical protein
MTIPPDSRASCGVEEEYAARNHTSAMWGLGAFVVFCIDRSIIIS